MWICALCEDSYQSSYLYEVAKWIHLGASVSPLNGMSVLKIVSEMLDIDLLEGCHFSDIGNFRAFFFGLSHLFQKSEDEYILQLCPSVFSVTQDLSCQSELNFILTHLARQF